jgi:hypothetical protein
MLRIFFYFIKPLPGEAGIIKDQSPKHEMTKARNNAKKFFVFSPPQADVFVINPPSADHKLRRIHNLYAKSPTGRSWSHNGFKKLI